MGDKQNERYYPRVEIKCDDPTGMGTVVKVDGEEIRRVRSIDYHVDVETSLATVKIECYCLPDIDITGSVSCNEGKDTMARELVRELKKTCTHDELNDIAARLMHLKG